MRHLSIDIETRSSVEIGKAGLYKYAQSPDFEILLFAYQMDEEPVEVVDLKMGEKIPVAIVKALADSAVCKHAYNAAFEWYCLNRAGYRTPLGQWHCTMAHGLYCGYTAGLDATGKAIGLPQDKQKLAVGKALIRYFCVPCKPTKSNGGRSWNEPWHAPEKWKLFKEYCGQDVVTEKEIQRRLELFDMPGEEWKQWRMDVQMNAYGVRVDRELIDGILQINARSELELTEEAIRLTGLENPNSTAQLLAWLNYATRENGEDPDRFHDLQKETVAAALERAEDLPVDVRQVLEIRQQRLQPLILLQRLKKLPMTADKTEKQTAEILRRTQHRIFKQRSALFLHFLQRALEHLLLAGKDPIESPADKPGPVRDLLNGNFLIVLLFHQSQQRMNDAFFRTNPNCFFHSHSPYPIRSIINRSSICHKCDISFPAVIDCRLS